MTKSKSPIQDKYLPLARHYGLTDSELEKLAEHFPASREEALLLLEEMRPTRRQSLSLALMWQALNWSLREMSVQTQDVPPTPAALSHPGERGEKDE